MGIKKYLLLVFIFSIELLNAQTEDSMYVQTMDRKIESIYSAKSVAEVEGYIFDFQRISEIEKDKWLPHYYMIFLELYLVEATNNKDKRKERLENVDAYLKEAEKRDGTEKNPELMVMRSRYSLLMAQINPFVNGAKYSAIAKVYAQNALKLAPDNPRAYLALSMFYLYIPKFLGGDTEKGCEILDKAEKLVQEQLVGKKRNIDPHWGKSLSEKLYLDNCF